MINWYNTKMPRWARILIQIFVGYLVSPLYRIFVFVDDCKEKKEEKHVMSLVFGILGFVCFLGYLYWIVDAITVIFKNEYSWLIESKKK